MRNVIKASLLALCTSALINCGPTGPIGSDGESALKDEGTLIPCSLVQDALRDNWETAVAGRMREQAQALIDAEPTKLKEEDLLVKEVPGLEFKFGASHIVFPLELDGVGAEKDANKELVTDGEFDKVKWDNLGDWVGKKEAQRAKEGRKVAALSCPFESHMQMNLSFVTDGLRVYWKSCKEAGGVDCAKRNPNPVTPQLNFNTEIDVFITGWVDGENSEGVSDFSLNIELEPETEVTSIDSPDCEISALFHKFDCRSQVKDAVDKPEYRGLLGGIIGSQVEDKFPKSIQCVDKGEPAPTCSL